jgi:hypothetical protein
MLRPLVYWIPHPLSSGKEKNMPTVNCNPIPSILGSLTVVKGGIECRQRPVIPKATWKEYWSLESDIDKVEQVWNKLQAKRDMLRREILAALAQGGMFGGDGRPD